MLVDEFQDLTPTEQTLVMLLRHPDGELVSLGDPRQSIYAFRGNDRLGLDRLDDVASEEGVEVLDVRMTECQRCPTTIVDCANTLMILSDEDEMVPASEYAGDRHLVHWRTPAAEARGMAERIASHVARTDSGDRTLVMVTRRQFGHALRRELRNVMPELPVDLTFSEGILELWPVREAFLFFCLVADPDPPTWRGWLGYRHPNAEGREYKAPERNAAAYLQFLANSNNRVTVDTVLLLADERRSQPRGAGGAALWDRARRFSELHALRDWASLPPLELLQDVFNPDLWVDPAWGITDEAREELQLLYDKAVETLGADDGDDATSSTHPIQRVARDLRYRVATREPFEEAAGVSLQITTLWGAKGLTAEHVYVIGLCDEALPGERADDYPGDAADYVDEQRRLFYVSITRPTRTLVLSRPTKVRPGDAKRLGLRVVRRREDGPGWARLRTCQFLNAIIGKLPDSVPGEEWHGVHNS